MANSVKLLASILLVALCGCVDKNWTRLSEEVTRLQLTRQEVGSFTEGECVTTPLSDWGFEVRCGANVRYARCGYHHGSSCCWSVEDADAATLVLGEGAHARSPQVCEGH